MSNLYYDKGPAPADGRKVFLATTSYDNPDASYTYSISRTREAMHQAGLPTSYYLLQGNCHVDDARNSVVADFMESDCSELVFLDADVSWQPGHLIRLCSHDVDLVGGVYPYRRDNGSDNMPVRNKPGHYVPDASGLMEVDGLPTGFMRIRRKVIETLCEKAERFDKKGQKIPMLFYRRIVNGGRVGGDIGFCMDWAATGGKIYADAELRLGHCGKHVIVDSLAASLRRQMGTSLAHVAAKVKDGTAGLDDYAEAWRIEQNPFGAAPDVLSLCVAMARKAQGHILEIGSGLTTILMAAARPDLKVWAIEHSPVHSAKLQEMAIAANVGNVMLVSVPLRNGWYDLHDDARGLPDRFSVAVVDGPPRMLGDRMGFFQWFGGRFDAALFDDADDQAYLAKLREYAQSHNMTVSADGRAAIMMRP